MHLELNRISKRYGYQWILRDLDLEISSGSILGINGLNGSGKSTLIKIISGFLSPSDGMIIHSIDNKKINIADVYKSVSWVAPYLSLTDNYTIEEMYNIQAKFKRMKTESFLEFIDVIDLAEHQLKYIKDFSSGMQQRLQLGLAILSDTPLLLLDEPTSFLDSNAISWYHTLLQKHINDRTVVIASNDSGDLEECNESVDVLNFK
jgi:ABC-type multidrug transport system ATPase subunit